VADEVGDHDDDAPREGARLMAEVNGRLPASALSPIPGGRLATAAALAWNAMIADARRRKLAVPMPAGPASSYRTYAQQVAEKEYWTAKGEPGNAATPGTSNHGVGHAVDVDPTVEQETIDKIGHNYGIARGEGHWPNGAAYSDAPWEAWHCLVTLGLWSPPKPPQWPFLPLREGKNRGKGIWVRVLRSRLRTCGFHASGKGKGPLITKGGAFNDSVAMAVKRFQRTHQLEPTGIVTATVWRELKKDAKAKVKHDQPSKPKPKKRSE
jgi:hypothetical protein